MKKNERQVEVLLTSLIEYVSIENVISALPRGYISVKEISGHTYYYRQWREGSKIISSYVPESYLNIIKQKIMIRKQNEELLRILKKEYRKAEKSILKAGVLNDVEIKALNEKVRSIEITDDNRLEVLETLKASL